MDRLKSYLLGHFEQLFVLAALLTTAETNFVLPMKLGFLNFYFLPVILAGYYLGRRRAVLGAVLCVLMIGLYVVLDPNSFHLRTQLELYALVPMRIVAVADAYDALTSWWPYHEPWAREAARDEIRRATARGVYDPRVVESLSRCWAEARAAGVRQRYAKISDRASATSGKAWTLRLPPGLTTLTSR
jgi:hypothetical protein